MINKTLIITVKKSDAERCGNYFNHLTCLVATALRRQFPRAKVIEVYRFCFQIDGEFFAMSGWVNHRIWKTYQLIKSDDLQSFEAFDFTSDNF